MIAVAAGIVLIAAAMLAMGMAREAADTDRDQPAAAAPQRVSVENGETVLRIDRETLARSGIVATPLAAVTGGATVPVFASVVDVARLTDLASASAIGTAQLAAARARAQASGAALARSRLLHADAQNISLAQLQAAEAGYQADKAGVEAAQAQAATALASARQEYGPALLPGGALVAAIVSRRSLLVQVALPADMGAPPSTLAIEGDGGVRAAARLVGPAARTDPRVPGRSVYYVVPASSGLVPGMSVTASLPVADTGRSAAVPEAAIVNWLGRPWVYRRRADGAFVRAALSTDRRDAQGDFIVRDLPPGAMIVTHGAQLLLSEELRGQAPAADSDED